MATAMTLNGFALLMAGGVALIALIVGIGIGYDWGKEDGYAAADDERERR